MNYFRKIQEILKKVVEINETGNAAFFKFQGHTNGIEVWIYKGKLTDAFYQDAVLSVTVYLDDLEAKVNLQLESLLTELETFV